MWQFENWGNNVKAKVYTVSLGIFGFRVNPGCIN